MHKGVDNIDLATNVNRRHPVSPPPARVDHVRGMPSTYEVNEFGYSVSNVPTARWRASAVVRNPNPVQSWPIRIPVYDPSDPLAANYYARHPEARSGVGPGL